MIGRRTLFEFAYLKKSLGDPGLTCYTTKSICGQTTVAYLILRYKFCGMLPYDKVVKHNSQNFITVNYRNFLDLPYKGHRSITVREIIYEKAFKKSQELKAKSLSTFIEDLILMNIEREEFLKRFAPGLSKVGFQNNAIYIKDHKTNRIAEIYLTDHHLWCSVDEASDCIHVHFALALPEIVMLKKVNHR